VTLWLRVRAPFAAFRWMQAGVYRATSPVIPPSAAWGLVLNLAHVETRAASDGVTTGIRSDAPPLRLAIGAVRSAEVGTLYQQLHSYPVGASGRELQPRAKGAKFWIAPVRREFLVGFDALIGVDSGDEGLSEGLLERIGQGLRGELGEPRYGLPFAGDNNLLIDRIDLLDKPLPAEWYAPMAPDAAPTPGSCRLTVAIDRRESAHTVSPLFAPVYADAPPESAWTWVPRAPQSASSSK